MPVANITGSAISYNDVAGAKTPVLLLHAFPLSSEMWAQQVETLSARGHRVITFDVRGFGKSGPASQTTAMSLIADDGASLLRHLGLDRAIVCGLSMGGYAAFEMVRRHGRMIAALVLADTKAGADSWEAKQNRETFAKNAVEKGVEWVASEMPSKLLKQPPDSAVDANVRRIIATGSPAGVAAAQRGMAARSDSNDLLPAISFPTLVIVGEDDKITPPTESESMAKAIPGAKLVKIPNAGHLSNLENPAAFNAALLGFVP